MLVLMDHIQKAEIRYHWFESSQVLKCLKDVFSDWTVDLEEGTGSSNPDDYDPADIVGISGAGSKVVIRKEGKLIRMGGFIKDYDFL